MAEYTPSRDAALGAARGALADLKAADWHANPAYWVGRLEVALAGVLRSVGPAAPVVQERDTDGCGAVDADDLDACGHCTDCTD
jgi:hypothetical protein